MGGPAQDLMHAHLSRRALLGAFGAASAGALLADPLLGAGRAAANTWTGFDPVTAAMHVHGSFSEGTASWESYGPVALAAGIDVVFMTDHDYRAWAAGYWTDMSGPTFLKSVTGSLRQQAGTKTGGTLRLLAESSSTTGAATVTMKAREEEGYGIREKLRTSISGTTLRPSFSTAFLSNGATLEIRITLSEHPAVGTRPAGTYQLWYRFGAGLAVGQVKTSGGLVGVMTRPLPAAGSSVSLDLQADVRALWPTMLALDNSFFGLSFVARSPRRGAVADLRFSCQIARVGRDAGNFYSQQRLMADTYAARYGFSMHPSIEVGRSVHVNGFAASQFIPDQRLNVAATLDEFYRQAVAEIHDRGGLASWNHPFGPEIGPLLSVAAQETERRQVFNSMLSKGLYDTDIIEVGYATRGQVDTSTHLALWDTFSRHGRPLTGNGVNDDHSADNWRTLQNGFSTGIWADTVGHASLMNALRSGRAYTAHAGKFPGAQLDLLVDGAVSMGKMAVSSLTSRRLEIQAANLPTGSRVSLVAGPVDYTGVDPGTTVLESIPAPSFGYAGIVSRSVDTSRSCFVRTQVLDSTGATIGVSNPIWLLRGLPPNGIPVARAA